MMMTRFDSDCSATAFKWGFNLIAIIPLMMSMYKGTTISKTRTASNSQDGNQLKKSMATLNKSKNMMTSSTSSMTTSVKKRTDNNSKSRKKGMNITQKSNTSLKALGEVTSSLNICKNVPRKDQKDIDRKANMGAIPIKNIKQKAAGLKTGQPFGSFNDKKTLNTKDNDEKGKENMDSKKELKKYQYYYPKESKKNVTPRQNSTLSVLNFTSKLQTHPDVQKQSHLALSNFEIGRKLGKGRFGDVFMAKDVDSGFVLAIKMVNKKEIVESDMINQLAQEIKIQMYSNHPNILKMYGYFDDHTKIYLLLELATNGCLFKEIRSKNYFSENLASFYLRQVSNGVRYLHSNMVIHRDIKPQNILNCFNVLKICDFGWSVYSPIYQRQTFCGTLDYVPPEIVTGEYYDERADVWCMGVLCYELCTGRAPFESKSDESETYDRILKVNIEFPIYLSALIVDFISRILNRDPSKRISLEEIQNHQWMRKYENQAGRMISKDIWEAWVSVSRN